MSYPNSAHKPMANTWQFPAICVIAKNKLRPWIEQHKNIVKLIQSYRLA